MRPQGERSTQQLRGGGMLAGVCSRDTMLEERARGGGRGGVDGLRARRRAHGEHEGGNDDAGEGSQRASHA